MKTAQDEGSIRKAAGKLNEIGNRHGWWHPKYETIEAFEISDPVGCDEFLDLAAEVLAAADA